MRIAYIHPPFETVTTVDENSSTASLVIWQNEVASRLAQKHQIVIYSKGDERHHRHLNSRKIEYRYLSPSLISAERRFTNGLTRLEQMFNYPQPKRPIIAGGWYYPLYIRWIARQLSHEHWDIIHITQFAQFAPVIRRYNPHARIVVQMHAPWLGQFDRAAVQPSLEAADTVIVVSHFLAQGILRNFPNLKPRVQVIHNGIDTNRFGKFADRKSADSSAEQVQHLLFVGRVSPEKGVHVLIDAFIRLADRFPNAVLEIVGGMAAVAYQFVIPMDEDSLVQDLGRFYQGPWRRDNYIHMLRRMIPDHLKSRIHFTGPRSQDELKTYFRRAAVCVFPSVVREAFSIALIEGMASGAPVICTEGGGGAEIMEHQVTGLLIPRGDVEALCSAISELLQNPELAQRYSTAAQSKVQGLFTWDDTTRLIEKHYLDLYNQSVDGKQTPLDSEK